MSTLTRTPSPAAEPAIPGTPELRRDANEVMQAVRAAFARVVEALPTPVGRPIQLSEALSLHRKLGWQVWKIIESANPYQASQYLPGPTGVRSFLASAARRGVPPELIKAAEDAAARIDELVSVHAGDRATLEMMLGSLAGAGARQVEELRRRDAYRGNTFIWGLQTRTLSYTSLVNAGAGDTLDIALLQGLIDLRRVRPDAPCLLTDSTVQDPGAPGPGPVCEPIASENGRLPHPLIEEFCTSPLPGVRRDRVGDGRLRLALDESPLGETGAITCRMGERFRNVGSRRRRASDPTADFAARVVKPAEVLVHDLIIRADLFGPIDPRAFVISDLAVPRGTELPLGARERLPVTVGVKRVGTGPEAAATRDIPGYVEVLKWAFRNLGWDGNRFDVYRVRLKFPVVPSSVVISFDLPE